MNIIKFMITDKQYIQVTPENIDKDDCEVCAQCYVDYIDKDLGTTIRFGYTELIDFQGGFGSGFRKKLLNNELFFDQRKRRDPGFEYCQQAEGIIKDSDVVEKYFFVGNQPLKIHPQYNSWLYNDKDGNIVFEISPCYEFYYGKTKKNDPNFITYAQFIKNYKPVIHKVISKEIFKQWNKQAEELTKTIK